MSQASGWSADATLKSLTIKFKTGERIATQYVHRRRIETASGRAINRPAMAEKLARAAPGNSITAQSIKVRITGTPRSRRTNK